MRTKVCGINSKIDIDVCLKAGVNALGFLVGITHTAEDKVTNDEAKALIESLPPFVSSVAVTHLTEVNKIVELVKYIKANTVQIHDYIPPEAVKEVRDQLPGVKIIKAVHVQGDESVGAANQFVPYVDALLLDSRTQDRLGGTGLTHDWNISKKIVESVKCPVILAGGLNQDNIYDAVKKVNPFGIDANSGVEVNSRKDYDKVSKFVSDGTKAFLELNK